MTTVAVTREGRRVNTTFIACPESRNNNTLFGADFLLDAGIILKIDQHSWCFADNLEEMYDLLQETVSTATPVSTSHILSLRPQEDSTLSAHQRKSLVKLIDDRADAFT